MSASAAFDAVKPAPILNVSFLDDLSNILMSLSYFLLLLGNDGICLLVAVEDVLRNKFLFNFVHSVDGIQRNTLIRPKGASIFEETNIVTELLRLWFEYLLLLLLFKKVIVHDHEYGIGDLGLWRKSLPCFVIVYYAMD